MASETDVRHEVAEAHELILCVSSVRLGSALELLERVDEPRRVQVIWSHSDPGLLRLLLEHGYQVFDAVVEGRNRLFADRTRGWFLPTLEPVPNALAAACQDMWRRNGTYLLLSGEVSDVFPERGLFRLRGRERFYIGVRPAGLPLPDLGSEVSVIALCPWMSSTVIVASAQQIAPLLAGGRRP